MRTQGAASATRSCCERNRSLLLIIVILSIVLVLQGIIMLQSGRSAQKMRAERDHLRAILDALPTLVGHVDANENITFTNATFQNEFGVSRDDIRGMKLRNLIGEDAYQISYPAIQRALAGDMSVFKSVDHKDERERWTQVTCIPDRRNGSKPSGFAALVNDVTESELARRELVPHHEQIEKVTQERTADLQIANSQLYEMVEARARAEFALHEREEHFRLLTEHAQDTVFRLELMPEPHITYLSPVVLQHTGYAPEDFYADPALWFGLLAQEDQPRMLAALANPLNQQDAIEARWRNKAGAYRWYEVQYKPLVDANQQCTTIVGSCRDITKRRAQDEQLRKLSRAVEQSNVSITIYSTDGTLEYANPQFTQISGFTLDEVKGKKPRILAPEKAHLPMALELHETLQTGKEWRGELQNVSKSGTLYWESGAVTPIYDSDGQITHFVAVMEDVTQRKQQEREREAILAVSLALRASDDRIAMLQTTLQEIATTFDAEKVFFISPDHTTGDMVVYAVHEKGSFTSNLDVRIAPGKGVAARVYQTGQPYVSGDAFADPRFAAKDLLDNARAVCCVPLIAQDSTLGVFSVARHEPFTSNDVRLLGAITDMAATGLQRAAYHEAIFRHAADLERAVAEQTSELREANKRLQELDMLKSKFVSDVSHELRTPVTNMELYLKLIRRNPDKQDEYLDILQEETERLESLVLDILNLAQVDNKPSLALAPIDLNALLQGVVDVHRAIAESRHLELRLQLADNLPVLMGDTSKLIQIATNLIINAINYTSTGFVRIFTQAHKAKWVRFSVEDSGTGIYAEDLPHLFDRFYRGKRDQIADVPGTGLGLSIVKELVDLHHGTIDVESEVGRGSTFTVSIPVGLRVKE